ncbi:mechanosensitive ion channel protein [Microbulbifer sp. A4B17]|uniref:mechanosensitive ion channel family protein n=1 Tax=Microbulbifer sp. A4B17 TaxID=359370 RepID=UPI000D52B3BA|nr:mechanosensitive ion channel family protein [Microbulbifer sp. A4B17]AWF83090.1 mechanosensitive ion channel protein [Microbulbifer sp. A4B17]
MNINSLSNEYWPQLTELSLKLGAALLVVLATLLAVHLARRAVNRLPERLDITLRPVLRSVSCWAIYIVGALLVLDVFGINTTSLIALLGATGVAVALALKDTLQNIASGFLLLGLRPFRVGDVIQFGTTMGTVREVGMFTTELDTIDGLRISAPNSAIWGQVLTNFSRNKTRRFEIVASIAYGDDIDTGLAVLRRMVAEEPRILAEPEPSFAVKELADSAVNLQLRAWAANDQYWEVYWSLMQQLKPALEAEGLTVPFPQRELHIVDRTAGRR